MLYTDRSLCLYDLNFGKANRGSSTDGHICACIDSFLSVHVVQVLSLLIHTCQVMRASGLGSVGAMVDVMAAEGQAAMEALRRDQLGAHAVNDTCMPRQNCWNKGASYIMIGFC